MTTLGEQGSARTSTRWAQFWLGSVDSHIYAVLRVLIGLVAFGTLAGLGDLSLYWHCDGLVMSSDGSVCQAARAAGLGWLPGTLLFAATALSFVVVIVGYKTVYSVSAAFLCLSIVVYWNPVPLSSAQQVLRNMLFCLVWADCGRVLSLDARLARRRRGRTALGAAALVPVWPLRLLQIQIAAVYLVTGLWKLANVTWRDGTALHYVLENNQFRRFPIETFPLDGVLTLATYFTLFWELGFAFMLLHPWTRRSALVIGVALHVGMWATLEIGSFSAVMLASYVAFVDPERVRRWVAGVPANHAAPDMASVTAPAGNLEAPR